MNNQSNEQHYEIKKALNEEDFFSINNDTENINTEGKYYNYIIY